LNTGITYKQITAFILLAGFLIQTFSGFIIVADYYTNTAAYAKNCINKARPNLKCHGKCQVMKKLAQEEKNEKENAAGKFTNKNEELLFSKAYFAVVPPAAIEIVAGIKRYQPTHNISIGCYCEIFHPPQNA
jgi:hypothetical protein